MWHGCCFRVSRGGLATLVVNKLRGILQCVAVKAAGFGDRRKAMLEDIAILAGGRVISEDLGLKLEKVILKDLGTGKRITVDKDNTTIVDGGGSGESIQGRVKQIRTQIEETTSVYDREKLNRGDFGVCEECGGEISEERLKVRPMAALCIKCKKKTGSRRENQRIINQTILGS